MVKAQLQKHRQLRVLRETWTLLTVGLCVAAVAALTAAFALPRPLSEVAMPSVDLKEARSGVIVVMNGNKCKRLKFDNETGRTIQSFRPWPCDDTPLVDATVGRLDAISKSFFAKGQ